MERLPRQIVETETLEERLFDDTIETALTFAKEQTELDTALTEMVEFELGNSPDDERSHDKEMTPTTHYIGAVAIGMATSPEFLRATIEQEALRAIEEQSQSQYTLAR